MKTHNYNPSIFEVNLASAVLACQEEIQKNLKEGMTIVETENLMERDNPILVFHIQDKEGDLHEVVIKVIQRPDKV